MFGKLDESFIEIEAPELFEFPGIFQFILK
jgi:hypothetical protein